MRDVSVFHGISTRVVEQVSLGTMLQRIAGGQYAQDIAAIRSLVQTGDEAQKKVRKARLVSFTPGCLLRTRSQDVPWSDKLLSCTGLVYYDLDHIPHLAAVRSRLLSHPHLVFAFVGPSGDGLKIGIAATGITGPTDYKHAWTVVLHVLKQDYPDLHISEDPHVKYLGALCFVSHDPTLYVNDNAVPFVTPPQPQRTPQRAQQFSRAAAVRSAYRRVVDALDAIPNHAADYETWLMLGMALHSTGESWARELWDLWSRQSAKFDERKQATSWASFHHEGGVTLGTLFHLAGQPSSPVDPARPYHHPLPALRTTLRGLHTTLRRL